MMDGPVRMDEITPEDQKAYEVSLAEDEKRRKKKAEEAARLLDIRNFRDPRGLVTSALSQFSANPNQGRIGRAFNSSSLLMNMSSMYPSLLR